jgi:hypothetical protein
MEKLPGKPMAWHRATTAQKNYFSRQLADIYLQIHQIPFHAIGCLQLSSDGLPEAGPAFFDYSFPDPVSVGPFKQSHSYFEAKIKHQISLIRSGEIGTTAPTDLYLVYMTMLNNLPPNDVGPFFLRHTDSRDVNFLINDDFRITGIVDWELSVVTSRKSAFQSPLLMYDLGELYGGSSYPSKDESRFGSILREEKDDMDLAAIAEQKLHFRIESLLDTDPSTTSKGFLKVGGRQQKTHIVLIGIFGVKNHWEPLVMETWR